MAVLGTVDAIPTYFVVNSVNQINSDASQVHEIDVEKGRPVLSSYDRSAELEKD